MPYWPMPAICGAKTRRGTRCLCKPVYGRRRCKFHGGMSLKPRAPLTEAGKKAISEAQKRRWQRWRAAQALADTLPVAEQGETK